MLVSCVFRQFALVSHQRGGECVVHLVGGNSHCLDIGVESAYTTEFLDGAEKPAEGGTIVSK